ncbi:MAG TPA: transglutaminase domain-containing protein, partial [Acetobacteraceae bacterium]|nr:transglutaminase domain-containing protein [Acetobacteraceae bacterium]
MSAPSRWLAHTPMTEPGAFEPLIKRLPADVAYLSRIVQGLLVHSEWLAAYALDPRAWSSISRATLPISQRLAALLDDGRALDEARAPAARAVGTCRDFALMLCSFLRTLGRPARVRCGFASYFGDGWADHWACQYQDSRSGTWLFADAQLDEVTRKACDITFNPSDLPPGKFLTAGEA